MQKWKKTVLGVRHRFLIQKNRREILHDFIDYLFQVLMVL